MSPRAKRTSKHSKNKRSRVRSRGSLFAALFARLVPQGHISNQRIWIIFVIGVVLFILIAYRLYEVQVVSGADYRQQVDNQHMLVTQVEDHPRGDIYLQYRDGSRILAATDRKYYQLVINNQQVRDTDKLASFLDERVDYSTDRLEAILQKENDPHEILKKRLSDEEVVALEGKLHPGVVLHARSERYYPLDDLVSEAVGFVSFREGTLAGTYGLEKYYDTILRKDGASSKESIFMSLFGEKEQVQGTGEETAIEKNIAKEGSLVTTIEPQVQEQLITKLETIDERFGSKYSAGIVVDPSTGEIVAMGSTKHFNPNTDKQHYRNVIIEDRYEFGSIMKPLSVAMAIDAGAIGPDFSYTDTGSLSLNRHTIYNYDKRGRGSETDLQTILSQSLNTGAATIALELGVERFVEYVDALGLSRETGIDLPYEMYGNTENIDTGREVELATASFGQGVAVTLIEMARAWGSLANDGVLMTPYLVDVIEYGDLIPSRNIPPGGDQRVFDSETTNDVTRMLVNIVDETATFRPYSLPQHSIAIKTGTAQLTRPDGGYYDDEFLHSLAGYFPAQAKAGEQQFVMILITYQPQNAQYSSTTLKDAFFDTAQFMISYYGLTPDRNTSTLNNYSEQ